ncbi:MAG: hypothetical protein QNM02_03755 [Acidimicrobiia bacterium]|nr:hypothetical protein [Acidimicrobiia bacterium]
MSNAEPEVDGATSFIDTVKNKLNDLLEVKVVTAVGKVQVTIDTANDSTTTSLGKTTLDGGSIVTVVKLLDGDVTTVLAPDLVDNLEVRAAHAAQVEASLGVIPNHLKTLVEMAEQLRDIV